MAAPQKNEAVKPEETPSAPPAKSAVKSNMLVMMLLFVVVLVEMIVLAFFLLPSPQKVKNEVDEVVKGEIDTTGKTPYKAIVSEEMQEDREEVELGEFAFTENDPTSSPFRMTVHFYGLVNKKDIEEYNKRYELNKNRIRNAILVILRSAPQAEVTDPSLGLIKNKIKVKVNEILGAPLIKGVLYTDIAVQTGG